MSTEAPSCRAAALPSRPVHRWLRATVLLACLAWAGCDTFQWPSLDAVAPRVRGRVVDAVTGEPLAGVRAGRRLSAWRQPTGGYLRGAEKLLLLQDEVRTGRDGMFELPPKRVALLFSLRDPGLEMDLELRHGRFVPWHTNFPIQALSKDPTEPRVDAGDLPLLRADRP